MKIKARCTGIEEHETKQARFIFKFVWDGGFMTLTTDNAEDYVVGEMYTFLGSNE